MKRRTKIILTCASATLVVALVVLRLSASRIVWSRIASSLHEVYGLYVESDDTSLALLSGQGTVRGLRILDAGASVLEAEELQISASITDIFRGTYAFNALVAKRPVLHIVVEESETTNLARICARSPASAGPTHFVFFDDARIIDGRVILDDAVTDHEHSALLTFENIDVTIHDLHVAGEPRSSEPGDIRLDALLTQKSDAARIALVAWGPTLSGPFTFAVHGAVTGLDLALLPQYVKRGTRTALGGDRIHLAGTLRAEGGNIVDGAIAAHIVESGADVSLRFGGQMSDIVFDKDSQLAALFYLPFVRLGHVGDVVLTSAWGAAGDVGQGVFDAGGAVVSGAADTVRGMIRFDPFGALQAAGGGVLQGAQSLGQGLVGGVRRLFGGGGSAKEEARADADNQRWFVEWHDQARRAMLAAALASAGDSTSARRNRIGAEIQAAPGEPAATVLEANHRRVAPGACGLHAPWRMRPGLARKQTSKRRLSGFYIPTRTKAHLR